MITITRELLREWDACYSDERIAEVVPPEGISPVAVCDLDIPTDDKFWVLLRPEILSDRKLRQFACWCASRALRATGVTDPRGKEAIRVAARFSVGKATYEELYAAWHTAWTTPWDSARRAAVCTTHFDARLAAADSAITAMRSLAPLDTYVGARDEGIAKRDAEALKQLKRLRTLLEAQ